MEGIGKVFEPLSVGRYNTCNIDKLDVVISCDYHIQGNFSCAEGWYSGSLPELIPVNISGHAHAYFYDDRYYYY